MNNRIFTTRRRRGGGCDKEDVQYGFSVFLSHRTDTEDSLFPASPPWNTSQSITVVLETSLFLGSSWCSDHSCNTVHISLTSWGDNTSTEVRFLYQFDSFQRLETLKIFFIIRILRTGLNEFTFLMMFPLACLKWDGAKPLSWEPP